MTRVLVAYASKMDSTREIADKIGSRLDEAGFDVLVRSCADAPPARGFSAVVIGSAIYMRRWLRDATTYLAREAPDLAVRPTYLFQSGPCSDKPSDSVVGTPRRVGRVARAIGASEPVTFGGRLDRSKATGPISRWVASGSMAGDYRDWAAISAWADSIAVALGDQQPASESSPPTSHPSVAGIRRRHDPSSQPDRDRGPSSPTPRISLLGRSQCEKLLAEDDVGRIAWRASSGLQLLPVNYAWHDGAIVLRISPDGVLAELVDPHDVVFEVDQLDQSSRGEAVVDVADRVVYAVVKQS